MKCSIEGCPGTYEKKSIVHTVRFRGQMSMIDHVPARWTRSETGHSHGKSRRYRGSIIDHAAQFGNQAFDEVAELSPRPVKVFGSWESPH